MIDSDQNSPELTPTGLVTVVAITIGISTARLEFAQMLEEVSVTAQKSAQSLQDVPPSISTCCGVADQR